MDPRDSEAPASLASPVFSCGEGGPYPDYEAPAVETIADLVRLCAERFAEMAAFEWPDGSAATYGRLAVSAETVASRLAAMAPCDAAGCPPPGPLVGIAVDDPFLFAAAFFGTLMAGCVAVLASEGDDPSALVGGRQLAVLLDRGVLGSWGVEVPSSVGVAAAPVRHSEPTAHEARPPSSDGDGGDRDEGAVPVRVILGSSGTSGARKAVMLTERGICADMVAGLQKYTFSKGGRYLALLPRSHAFGLVCDLMAPLATGGTICVVPDSRAAVAMLAHFAPTQLNVPPRFAAALADLLDSSPDPERVTGGRLRKILCGGAGVDASLIARLRAYGIEAFGCYGLSECSPCVAVNRDEWHKDGSAGVPLNCNEIFIEADGGLMGAPAVGGASTPVGQICIRGTNVMAGYLDRPDLTETVLDDGLLRTGDVGRIDADGFLWVVGRMDDTIVLQDGTKVAPEELEAALRELPEVAEALVLSAEADGGEGLGAVVRACEGYSLDAVGRQVRAVRLPGGRMLAQVRATYEELPKTPTGKLIRKGVR